MDIGNMHRAIELAAVQHAHPNPRVGAVIVAGGRIIGEGAHQGPGTDHAEIVALSQAGSNAAGASVYVTLEPCSHYGRTPPCVDALLEAGVSEVFVGSTDPDPRVAGRGIRLLMEAGVRVQIDVAHQAARALDPGYFIHRELGRPRVTLKSAATLDGQMAAQDGTSQWITSEEARLDAHHLRSRFDAIAIGVGTLIQDDPLLTVRLPNYEGPQPLPVVFAGRRELPRRAQLYERDPLILVSRGSSIPAGRKIEFDGDPWPSIPTALKSLAMEGILDLLIEGGPTLARSFLDSDLVDAGVLYLGARLAGGAGSTIAAGSFETLSDARLLALQRIERVGPDLRIDYTLEA